MSNHLRPFGPKSEDHHTTGRPCPACGVLFKAGDYTTLVAFGPGADEEQQERARLGQPHNAVAAEAHWTCVTGYSDEEAAEIMKQAGFGVQS